MRRYDVDFAKAKSLWEFYDALIQGLELPDWCGRNPDAIWDMLTGRLEYPAEICLKHLERLPKSLINEKQVILNVFNRLEQFYSDQRFCVEIEKDRS